MPVAIGDRTAFTVGDGFSMVLLAPTTATNNPPSTVNDGLALINLYNVFTQWPKSVTLTAYSTAGSGTMTCTLRLWGLAPNATGTPIWVPCGPGSGSTKGILNLTSAIDETGSDAIRHSEVVDLPAHFQSLYCEVTAIGGTSTSITVELVARRNYP